VSELFTVDLRGGSTWSHVLKRHTALRLTDLEGGANVALACFNYENLTERLNLPDTLKAQHIARLTAGSALYSDMGRVLLSVTEDSVGWHDPLAGFADAKAVAAKYGARSYQEHRNDWYPDAKTGFLLELGKYGMTIRDLPAVVNFFSKVQVDDGGGMVFAPNHSAAGAFVELRSEMNTLVVINTCPHPMNPARKYPRRPVRLTVKRVPAPAAADPCRLSRPENERGFILTERYFL
jgi:urea carboxylase-associated protein 2